MICPGCYPLYVVRALLLIQIIFSGFSGLAVAEEQGTSKQKSGYQGTESFGGPNSVGETLKNDDRDEGYRFVGLHTALSPYFSWKEGINKNYGLALSLDYNLLYQKANESAGDEDDAAGGIFRFFGSWAVLDRGGDNPGSIVVKVENRHRLGTDIVPQTLGFEIGYSGSPGAQFGDTDWILSNLHWLQKTNNGRLNFVAGIIDPTDYLNVYAMVDPLTAFSNLAFLTGTTIPAPSQGLGAAVGWAPIENMYLLGGLYDANGDPSEPDNSFESFFEDHEYLKQIEIGWMSSFERRFLDNVHLTMWHADEKEEVGVEDGWGLAFSATKFIDDTWLPFLRIGYADDGGALWERSVCTGLGYYFSDTKDLLGVGLNWGSPADGDDQYTTEVFYRLQLTPNFAITPDIQLFVDPAQNPDEDALWVFGLRARLTL
jgi:porin